MFVVVLESCSISSRREEELPRRRRRPEGGGDSMRDDLLDRFRRFLDAEDGGKRDGRVGLRLAVPAAGAPLTNSGNTG